MLLLREHGSKVVLVFRCDFPERMGVQGQVFFALQEEEGFGPVRLLVVAGSEEFAVNQLVELFQIGSDTVETNDAVPL